MPSGSTRRFRGVLPSVRIATVTAMASSDIPDAAVALWKLRKTHKKAIWLRHLIYSSGTVDLSSLRPATGALHPLRRKPPINSHFS
jgi:hypothetical protein